MFQQLPERGGSHIEPWDLGVLEPSVLESEFVLGPDQLGARKRFRSRQIGSNPHLEIQAELMVAQLGRAIWWPVQGTVPEEVLYHPEEAADTHLGAKFLEHFSL